MCMYENEIQMECDASLFGDYILLGLVYRYDVPVQLGVLFTGNCVVGGVCRVLCAPVFAG